MKTDWTLCTEEINEIEALDVKSVFETLKSMFAKVPVDGETVLKASDMKMQWNSGASYILEVVSERGTGFKKDIAEKAIKFVNISDKQAWCVAFEFIAINK